jgi:membrane-associated protease RseP (regulator of RpoE activity)
VLVEPNRTSYDLNFRLFGFPVRVHPLFWVGAVIFGADYLQLGLVYLLIWVGVVFVSILVHELGHALAYRLFGTGSHVILYVFGGLAVPWSSVAGRWRRVVVYLAGPGAGFVLCAAVYVSNEYFGWADPRRSLPLFVLYFSLYGVNLYWGVLNLLPVFPLDGGRVSQEVCSAVSRRNGDRIALEISVGFAGLVCLYSLACLVEARQGGGWLSDLPRWFPRGSLWTAILFGLLAYQSFLLLQQLRWTGPQWGDDDDRPPWK